MYHGMLVPSQGTEDEDSHVLCWSRLEPTNPPSARSGHSLVPLDTPRGQVLALFGGMGPNDPSGQPQLSNETFIFDPTLGMWSYLEVDPGFIPEPRYNHRATVRNGINYNGTKSLMYISGGFNSEGHVLDSTAVLVVEEDGAAYWQKPDLDVATVAR